MRKLSMEELNRPSVEEFKESPKIPLVIILDNVRSMNNVGSAFRTSDAFAVEKIYLTGITATPPHRDIHKTALGAEESVSWQHAESTLALVKELQAQQYLVYAIEQAQERIWLQDFQPVANQKYAFVFGNEVFGVDEEVMKLVNGCLEIPQVGTKHSLNISVSMGIAIWDFYKKVAF
ncbi:RNA methyltransferase [Cytophagales bacterium LB-30]|uniref:RNA methyltransferase n=1 Tax=Shiella aurantiaca TaxID=3058365 RepID=A0ABT8F6B1_9BACT|nr:RNA methyltransferase [Shiella aurantiaca]MDN4165843.1 RNA methyltransferase [Shiella aurantiaca]